MQLQSFRVQNFRSINDSGDVKVSRITALLGRNESGKSNLLLALRSLNPAEGFSALSPIKDFPRHKHLKDCTDQTPVLHTQWLLTDAEKQELRQFLPGRASQVTHVEIGRYYGDKRWVSFPHLAAETFDEKDTRSKIKKIVAAVGAASQKLEEEPAAIHLPATKDVEVYNAIFKSLRSHLIE